MDVQEILDDIEKLAKKSKLYADETQDTTIGIIYPLLVQMLDFYSKSYSQYPDRDSLAETLELMSVAFAHQAIKLREKPRAS